MTMAAAPAALEGRQRGSLYETAGSDIDAEGESDPEEPPPNKTLQMTCDPEESGQDAMTDGDSKGSEEGDDRDGSSMSTVRPRTRRGVAKKADDSDVDLREASDSEESSVVEESESDNTDSEAESIVEREWEASSEAAGTTTSAEVQNRNNCVSVSRRAVVPGDLY